MNVLLTSASRKVWLVRAFQRALQSQGGGAVIAVDASPYSAALRVADKAFLVPRGVGREFIDRLLEIARAERVTVVVPTRDEELVPLADARTELAEAGVSVILPPSPVVRLCQNKKRFAEFCVANGFGVPKILDPEAGELEFPVFVRGEVSKASQQASRADSPEELRYLRNRFGRILVQEYVEAPEYTVDLFADFAGQPISVVPRQRLMTLGGESFIGRTVRHDRIMEASARLASSLGLVGFNTIQCFWHNGEVKFVEVNPRIGGGANLGIAAGADSPRYLLQLLTGEQVTSGVGSFRENYLMLRYTEDLFISEEEVHEFRRG